MPPKKAPAKKLHELAAEVRVGYKIADITKKTYVVGKQFATGGFGRIHTCTEEGKSQQLVMKIEPATNGPLTKEVVVFNRILKKEHLEAYKKKKKIGWIGLPYIIANGYFTYNEEKMRYMVIPKYAMSLEAAREANGGVLSLKDTLTVSLCVLGALEYMHDVEYAHADIKAANILLERQNDFSSAVLVDFGLAHKTSINVDKPDKKRAHNGTCIFTSIDAHRGNNPSFRGDVEILAYNIILWITGTLPWMSLESSPDKVFDAKQKFLAGLPGSLENALKSGPSHVVSCVTSMFQVATTTGYTSKVDMEKVKKLVETAILKTSDGGKKKASGGAKSSRKHVEPEEEEDEEVEEEKPKKKIKKVAGTSDEVGVTKKTPSSRLRSKTSRRIPESDDDEEEEEVIVPRSSKSRRKVPVESEEDDDDVVRAEDVKTFPQQQRIGAKSRSGLRLGVTSSTASTDSTARKIEKKYKRLSMNKSKLVPVQITVPSASKSPECRPSTSSGGTKRRTPDREDQEDVDDDDDDDEEGETVTLKTPALVNHAAKKAKYKSGISSATKASPTELRRVPGVRNFPKGRRSMIIKETAAKYKEKRAGNSTAKPTFVDSGDDEDGSEL